MKIKITSFQESESDIRHLRDTVFGSEQGVPREIDWDGEDEHCVQALAWDRFNKPVGTGRLRPDGKIGRLAVLTVARGKGVGARVVEALIEAARANQHNHVYLHAQTQAVSFYEKLGFEVEGNEFIEADILHLKMIKKL